MEYARRAAHADEKFIALDYDGTLAPFTADRDRAFPYEGVRNYLEGLQALDSKVVIVSGRAALDVDRLLNIRPRPEIWGSHGWERWFSDEIEPRLMEMSSEMRKRLGEIGRVARNHAPEDCVEIKPAGVAIHWRGLNASDSEKLRVGVEEFWKPWSATALIDWHRFDGGVELRARGRNKGDVIRTLLDESPGAVAAYLGDDLTDEDAFQALKGSGLAVLVRKRSRPTCADAWIRPPEELLEFLGHWLGGERNCAKSEKDIEV